MSEDNKNQTNEAWAVYLRVSDENVQYPERSIPRQRRRIQAVLLDHSDLPVYREYEDWISGRRVDRSGYQQLLADARAGRFSHLALAEGSRFGRDMEEWMRAMRELIELGIQIKPADMPSLDVDTPDGFFIAVVMGGLAQYEVQRLGQRVRGGMQVKLLRGDWPFKAPDGYVNKKKEISTNKWERWIEVDPERGPIHSLIFDLYASRQYTLLTLAEELNRRGYRNPRGNEWSPQGVHRRLINAFYMGKVESKVWDISLEGNHEPLTNQETWELCQQILREQNMQSEADVIRFRNQKRVYPLVGVLWSQETGGPFYGATCKGRNAYYEYYRSRDEWQGKHIYVQTEVVHKQILLLLSGIHISDEAIAALHRLYRLQIDAEVEKWFKEGKPQKIHQRIVELENEQRTLLRFALKRSVSEREYLQEKRRIEEHIGRLQRKLLSIEERNQDVAVLLNYKLDLLDRMGHLWGQATPLQQRALGREVFKRITIDWEGEIMSQVWTPPVRHLTAGISQDGVKSLHWVLRVSSLLEDVQIPDASQA